MVASAPETRVFLTFVNDRHTEPTAVPFTTSEEAILHARKKAEENARSVDNIEEQNPPPGGWLYYATYSEEGDCVWVVEATLHGALPQPAPVSLELTDDDRHWIAVAIENSLGHAKDRLQSLYKSDLDPDDFEVASDYELLLRKYTELQGKFPGPEIGLSDSEE